MTARVDGASPVTAGFAGLPARLGAYALDGVAGGVVTVVGLLPAVLTGRMGLALFGLVLIFAYNLGLVWWLGARGRTPGKAVLGLRVVDQVTLAPIGFARALVRFLLLGLLGMLNVIQLFVIPRHPRKQGWHDLAARSVVMGPGAVLDLTVRNDPVPPARAATATAALIPEPPQASESRGFIRPVADDADRTVTSRPSAPAGMVPPPPGITPPPAPPSPALLPSTTPPPAAPRAVVPPPSPTAAMLPPPSATPYSTPEELERTQVSVRRQVPATAGWRLRTADGAVMEVAGKVLVGRDPDLSLVTGCEVWRIDDPGLSVSKTHAMLAVKDAELYVEDWHSTNGTRVVRSSVSKEIAPHTPTALGVGDVIALGEFTLTVESGA